MLQKEAEKYENSKNRVSYDAFSLKNEIKGIMRGVFKAELVQIEFLEIHFL